LRQPDEERPTKWAIRLTPFARADIAAAWDHFSQSSGEEVADAWQQGLEAEIMRLSLFPTSSPVADEDDLFSATVHKLLYRRTRRGPAYQIFFTLRTSPDDAPTVLVMHIRHAARAPMTRLEAREIESSE